MTQRPEERPDPREAQDRLALRLNELCSEPLVLEVAALVVFFDVCVLRYFHSHIIPDELLAACFDLGPEANAIYDIVRPDTATPERLDAFIAEKEKQLCDMANRAGPFPA